VDQPRAWGLLITRDDTLARENAQHAAKQWQDLQKSEHAALSHARKYQAVNPGTTAQSAVERALAHVGELIAQAQANARRLTEDMQQAPSLGLLTHSIGRLVARLEPREITQVRMLLTAPQAALAFAARESVKDIVLGREGYY
jgi:DNA-directed RNA polymerase subunit F